MLLSINNSKPPDVQINSCMTCFQPNKQIKLSTMQAPIQIKMKKFNETENEYNLNCKVT